MEVGMTGAAGEDTQQDLATGGHGGLSIFLSESPVFEGAGLAQHQASHERRHATTGAFTVSSNP
jgi:hypothetical protein